MVTLYSLTILAGLALLAIVIAIFVFAASIYRTVLELSAKEQEDALNRRKELINNRRKEVIEKIKGVDDSAFLQALRTELDKVNTELDTIDRSILKSRDKAKALTVRNMVAIPASFLLMSIITSGIAIATSGILPTIMGIVSLASIVTGSYFIYRNLSTVEFFSKLIDLGTLMEQALDRHRLKSTPIMEVDVWDFMLEVGRGETREIKYDVYLKQGSIGRNTEVQFMSTEELNFPEEKPQPLGIKGEHQGMKKPKVFVHKLGDINPKTYKIGEFKVKVPDQLGEYTMRYWILCDEYTGDETTFKIKVI